MSQKKDYAASDAAVIREWERYKEKGERNFEAAQEGLRTFFKKALSNDNVREAISADLKEVRQGGNRPTYNNEAGYNLIQDDYDPLVDGGTSLETSWSPPED